MELWKNRKILYQGKMPLKYLANYDTHYLIKIVVKPVSI